MMDERGLILVEADASAMFVVVVVFLASKVRVCPPLWPLASWALMAKISGTEILHIVIHCIGSVIAKLL